MKNVFEEIGEFIYKNITLITSLMVGSMIKAAIDIKTKQLRWWERFLNVIICVCVGWMSWKGLIAWGKESWTGFIVPLATLFGETFAMWLIVNGGAVLTDLKDKFLKDKK